MWTLSCLQTHPHPLIVVDEDATLELQVKTVKVRRQYNARICSTDVRQYFKSIEMVANEQGFQQSMPKKRDSLLDEDTLLAPEFQVNGIQDNGITLTVPQFDISRSASPNLEPMSARLTEQEEAKIQRPMHELEDFPTIRMSARVGSY